jgi:hypothetical protein
MDRKLLVIILIFLAMLTIIAEAQDQWCLLRDPEEGTVNCFKFWLTSIDQSDGMDVNHYCIVSNNNCLITRKGQRAGYRIEITQPRVITNFRYGTAVVNELSPEGGDRYRCIRWPISGSPDSRSPNGGPGGGGLIGDMYPILESALCKGVDENEDPVDRTTIFSTNDEKVCSWIKIGPTELAHTVEWKMYSPDNDMKSTSEFIPPVESDFRIYYRCMNIKGSKLENAPGSWRVEIYMDGVNKFTQQFTIEESIFTDDSGEDGGSEQIPGDPEQIPDRCFKDPTTGEIICICT